MGKKRSTVGFDINRTRIEELAKGVDKTNEVCGDDLELSSNLTFSYNESDIEEYGIYVTVPTPIDNVNRPNLSPLTGASELAKKYLKPDDIVIFESTVYPGCTEEVCVPILEKFQDLPSIKIFIVVIVQRGLTQETK